MKSITFLEVKQWLEKLTAEQLACTATVYDPYNDEFLPISDVLITDESDVLDENHPYLKMAEP